jgi:calcineurin-like phosphoesterase family protein
MSIYFTSDTHFGHKNILRYCPDRPFNSVDEMDRKMVDLWNKQVLPNDDVYHLGDFTFYNDLDNLQSILDSLNGKIHLILGNHDEEDFLKATNRFSSIQNYLELNMSKKTRLVLFHYPISEWRNKHRDWIHFHGHSHGNMPKWGNRYDVGVDATKIYRPASFEEIMLAHKNTPTWVDKEIDIRHQKGK